MGAHSWPVFAKEPEDSVLRARDRRRRPSARALRRRRLRATRRRLEAATLPRVGWTGSSPFDHPVVDALEGLPAGVYAVRWGSSWEAEPIVQLSQGEPSVDLGRGEWHDLTAVECLLRGGEADLQAWREPLIEAILAAEAPWRRRCPLPLLDERESWARVVGYAAWRGLHEPSGLWAWLSEVVKQLPGGPNGRAALGGARKTVLGVLASCGSEADVQRGIDLLGLLGARFAKKPPRPGSVTCNGLGRLGGLPLDLAEYAARTDLHTGVNRLSREAPSRLAPWLRAMKGMRSPSVDDQRQTATIAAIWPQHLEAAVAWYQTLRERKVRGSHLGQLVRDLRLGPIQPRDLRRLLQAGLDQAELPEGNIRQERAVRLLALQGHVEPALTLLPQLRESVSNQDLAAKAWNGDPVLALSLLRGPVASWQAVAAWDHLDPSLRPFFRACMARPERLTAACAVLERLYSVRTLPTRSVLRAAIEAWAPGSDEVERRVARLCTLLGRAEPKELRKLRTWRERHLQQLDTVDGDIAARLRQRLASPGYAQHMADRLRFVLAKTEEVLGLEWLARCADDAIAAHFQSPGRLPPEGLHAAMMALRVQSNRRIAHKLVRAALQGDSDWRNRHPENRRWLARMDSLGLDTQAWLAPRRLEVGDLVARTSSGPLEDLLMGQRFHTCLALDGCNAHAAVANAAELNKRVLWVEREGQVVARKLVVLDDQGGLLGFALYGDWDPRRQLAADLLARELAQAAGAHLKDQSEVDLALFAQWYNDGTRPWDWWLPLAPDAARVAGRDPDRWEEQDKPATLRLALLDQEFFSWAEAEGRLKPEDLRYSRR